MTDVPYTPVESEHGRLRLLDRAELIAAQRALAERLDATRVEAGRRAGYRTVLDDGRLIGPFNALLRVPEIGGRQLDWVDAIASGDLSPTVREVAVLTVAALWQADYVLHAHTAAGRTAGLDDRVVDDLVAGRTPNGLADEERLAHDVALALVRDHDVPDDLYRRFLAHYGESRAVTLLALVGQYLATCVVVTCFRVPAARR